MCHLGSGSDDSDSVDLGWGPRGGISNKFPDDAEAAGLASVFSEGGNNSTSLINPTVIAVGKHGPREENTDSHYKTQ